MSGGGFLDKETRKSRIVCGRDIAGLGIYVTAITFVLSNGVSLMSAVSYDGSHSWTRGLYALEPSGNTRCLIETGDDYRYFFETPGGCLFSRSGNNAEFYYFDASTFEVKVLKGGTAYPMFQELPGGVVAYGDDRYAAFFDYDTLTLADLSYAAKPEFVLFDTMFLTNLGGVCKFDYQSKAFTRLLGASYWTQHVAYEDGILLPSGSDSERGVYWFDAATEELRELAPASNTDNKNYTLFGAVEEGAFYTMNAGGTLYFFRHSDVSWNVVTSNSYIKTGKMFPDRTPDGGCIISCASRAQIYVVYPQTLEVYASGQSYYTGSSYKKIAMTRHGFFASGQWDLDTATVLYYFEADRTFGGASAQYLPGNGGAPVQVGDGYIFSNDNSDQISNINGRRIAICSLSNKKVTAFRDDVRDDANRYCSPPEGYRVKNFVDLGGDNYLFYASEDTNFNVFRIRGFHGDNPQASLPGDTAMPTAFVNASVSVKGGYLFYSTNNDLNPSLLLYDLAQDTFVAKNGATSKSEWGDCCKVWGGALFSNGPHGLWFYDEEAKYLGRIEPAGSYYADSPVYLYPNASGDKIICLVYRNESQWGWGVYDVATRVVEHKGNVGGAKTTYKRIGLKNGVLLNAGNAAGENYFLDAETGTTTEIVGGKYLLLDGRKGSVWDVPGTSKTMIAGNMKIFAALTIYDAKDNSFEFYSTTASGGSSWQFSPIKTSTNWYGIIAVHDIGVGYMLAIDGSHWFYMDRAARRIIPIHDLSSTFTASVNGVTTCIPPKYQVVNSDTLLFFGSNTVNVLDLKRGISYDLGTFFRAWSAPGTQVSGMNDSEMMVIR